MTREMAGGVGAQLLSCANLALAARRWNAPAMALRHVVAASITVALSLAAERAEACHSNESHTSDLLGVAPDGSFVVFERDYSEMSDEGVVEAFVARDAKGEELDRLTAGAGMWFGGASYFDGVRRSPPIQADQLRAEIISSKKLEAPKPRGIRHVASDRGCGSLELESKTGWLRVAEVGSGLPSWYDACYPITVEAFDDPRTDVLFVRVSDMHGERPVHDDNETFDETDRIELLPKTRVRAAELWLKGERARLKGKRKEARRNLEQAFALAPEYLPARISLLRLAAKEHAAWDTVQKVLFAPFPEGAAPIGAWPDSTVVEGLIVGAWPDAHPPGENGWEFPWMFRGDLLRDSFLAG